MVAPDQYIPDRGDLVWLNFSPQAGHEQAGRRPALILSPKKYNFAANLALVCPITNRKKGYPFEVPLPVGARVSGVILADHIKSIDWNERHAVFIERAPLEIVSDVLKRLLPLLNV